MDMESDGQPPFLTTDLPGIGGMIRVRHEDFLVEELPLYDCCGQGEYVYARLEKRGLPTFSALRRLAQALGAPRRNIAYAGLKDARALTRQWVSVTGVEPEQLAQLDLPGLKVLEVHRHTAPLRIGQLAGNRFSVRLRRCAVPLEQALDRARGILDVIVRRGVPNYFGPQRFGARSDTPRLGAAIIARDPDRYIDLFLGASVATEQEAVCSARDCYDRGDYAGAWAAWPAHCHEQRHALRTLVKNGGDKNRAYNVLDRHLKRFHVSAFQSHLFNRVLVARMPHIDRLLPGEIAYRHQDGSLFTAADPQDHQARCDVFEISPTGPLYGPRMPEAQAQAALLENSILAPTGLARDDFRRMRYYQVKGARRPLRFRPRRLDLAAGSDELGPFLQCQFDLDPGCYATVLLREITKTADFR